MTDTEHTHLGKAMRNGLRYPRFLWVIGTAIALQVVAWGLLFWLIPPTGADVILHYNIYFGADLLGNWQQLLLIPITGAVVLVLNAVLALVWQATEPVLAAIVEVGAVGVQLLCIIAIVALYFQNLV